MTKSDENSKKILQKKNIFLRIHTSSVRDDAINELFNKKEIVSQIGEAMARLNNSKISIFSSLSMAGINLNKFTGIAVILISPMQEPAPSSDEEDYAKYLK
ncbi:hypothetical protein A3Q56_07556 [Intoshia linei]|uniref:Uncharacterized protein n=1 Tax=Intoshia linei TaxID=1819745 RepID=A0A177ATM4_9BILA|nr:hypothetical protein A3Q56_07556 [Intoshia linei]